MPRIIQVPIDDDLLGKLDALSGKKGQSRASVIREACRKYVTEERRRQMDDEYEAGYRRIPEDPALGEAYSKNAALVWGFEDFSDWYDK
jgi:metal-responsive CopG/Arc/MetJ family transcriptional regulator